MRVSDVPQSGKRGTIVSANTRYGLIQRQFVVPKDPSTPAQMRIRSNLGRVASRWRVLTVAQRNAWITGARDKYGKPPPGSQVCIRTRQQINGWEDLPKQTSAIVPTA